jgi:hypothetical protein
MAFPLNEDRARGLTEPEFGSKGGTIMSTISQAYARIGILSAIAVFAALAFAPSAGATDGVVGPGNCNEGGFDSVLAAVDGSGGGTITFNCGTATIAFTGYKQIANAVTIDGGGRITLDGVNATPLFQIFASAHATLKGLTLERGVYNGVQRQPGDFGERRRDQPFGKSADDLVEYVRRQRSPERRRDLQHGAALGDELDVQRERGRVGRRRDLPDRRRGRVGRLRDGGRQHRGVRRRLLQGRR